MITTGIKIDFAIDRSIQMVAMERVTIKYRRVTIDNVHHLGTLSSYVTLK